MNRRTLLAAIGAAGTATTSGCLGNQTHDEGALDVQRPGSNTGDECDERELLDFERVYLGPRYFFLFGFRNAVQWEVALREGEELYVRITSGDDVMHLPRLEVTDPDGDVVLEEDSGQNIHRINPDADGPYTLWIGNERPEAGAWYVDLVWYSGVGCSDPYS